jgi:hypothetical protein
MNIVWVRNEKPDIDTAMCTKSVAHLERHSGTGV